MTLILIILWAFTAGSVIFLRKATLVSYFSCVTVIFLLQVLPKILAYDSWGFSAFLESTVDFSTNNVQTANILIFSFIITINLCYMTNPPNVLEAYSATDIVTWNRRSESVARFAVLGVFLPLSGVALAFYLSQIGFSMDMLIAKREFQIDGTITPAYIGQKVAQISKSGFYLACIGYVCSQNKKRWFRIMLLMSLLTSVVYVTSSQRSGVLILLLEIFLTLLIGKRLRVRTFVIFGAMFALVSLKILFSRFGEGSAIVSLYEMIFRRYFFDLEKIAAIYQFSVKPDAIISPLEGLFQISTAPWPDDNIHYFIAEHIFGMVGNGVPPSILGEIILILGPIYVIPVTLLTTILILAAEKYMMRTRKGAHKIFMVLLLSKAYFLLPNSDMLSTIRRIVFDTGLFYGGLVTYYLLIGYFQRVQPPSGGASRGNTPESRGLL